MSEADQWQIQEAKSKFSALIHAAQRAPQTITKHGEPVAVVVSATEYDTIRGRPKDSFLEFMRSTGLGELELERDKDDTLRDIEL